MKNIEIILAGIPIRLGLRLPETASCFQSFLVQEDCSSYDVCIREEETRDYPLICPDNRLTPAAESYILMAHVSRYLLKKKRVLIHGTAFCWQDKAWLITGPSGIGKTTQLRYWQKYWKDEIELIGGDKCVLEECEDSTFRLYPSPWTGKEKDQGTGSGILGGMILLRQDECNCIASINAKEAVVPLFDQLLINGETKEELIKAGAILDGLLKAVPVYLLKNRGDAASAILTRDYLMEKVQ